MENYRIIINLASYLIGAVFFVCISKKCFMEKWQIRKAFLFFLLSPAVGYALSYLLSLNHWERILEFDNTLIFILNILVIEGIQVIVQAVMLFLYVKLVRAKNISISVFIYLCSTMFVPNVYFLSTSRTIIPFFLYMGLYFLFYFTTVRPLSEITRTRQITNAKLFVILPAITFLFNAVMRGCGQKPGHLRHPK